VRGETFGNYDVIDYRLRVHAGVTNKRCRAVLKTVNSENLRPFALVLLSPKSVCLALKSPSSIQ
jgi:hypothetical protein